MSVCGVNQVAQTCSLVTTSSQGTYSALGVPAGLYEVTVNPPSGSSFFEQSQGPETVVDGDVTEVDFELAGPLPLPSGTTIGGISTNPDGTPVLNWEETSALTTNGCPDGSATFTVTANNSNTNEQQQVTGSLTETPLGSGHYVGTIPALYPLHGAGSVAISITCPNPSQDTSFSFGIYIDPSGTVVNTSGNPIVGATVTLLSGDSAAGPFFDVPGGSPIMSPANRNNPDTTSESGSFGWDVVPGYYEVEASAPGCYDPADPTQTTVSSPVFEVPPPITNLQLVLACGTSAAPPAFTSTSSDAVAAGTAFSFTVTTTGTPTPAISLDSGSTLPPGVTLTDNGNGTATLAGTSSVISGVYNFTIDAANGVSPNATQPFRLTETAPPAFTSTSSDAVAAGTAFSFTVTTTGTPTPAISLDSGSTLPPGVTLTDNGNGTATLAGTSSVISGVYNFTIDAANGVSPNATQPFRLTETAPPAFTSTSSDAVAAGTAFSFTVTTTGTPTPAISLDSGSTLPPGVTLTDNGNGTATLAGTSSVISGVYNFTIDAANGVSPNATQPFRLTETALGTAVSLQFKGSLNYTNSGSLTSGGFTISPPSGTVSSVSGTGTIPGVKGGSAAITVNIHRVAFFGSFIYIGSISVTDPGGQLKTTALVLSTSLTRVGVGGLSGTAGGVFYVLKWTI